MIHDNRQRALKNPFGVVRFMGHDFKINRSKMLGEGFEKCHYVSVQKHGGDIMTEPMILNQGADFRLFVITCIDSFKLK